MTQKTFTRLEWSTGLAAVVLPTIAWGQSVDWQLSSLTPYQWFPLFGLLAWMLMWTHYIAGTARILTPSLQKSEIYRRLSGYAVLLALLLHPGILAFEQYQNDQGIPPQSFISYVGEGLTLAVMFGSLALTLFLSFEVFDRLQKRSVIKKWWWAISISQSVAMLLIFVHAIRLGAVVGDGWFQLVWFLCGLSLLPCFYIIHAHDFKEKSS